MADNEYDLFVEEGVSCALAQEELRAACDAVLAHEGVGRPCSVSVSVVGEPRMREINAEWRDVDAATDVISIECERPDDPSLAPGEPCELGDIVIAPDYIARQAAAFGTTPADETRLMLVHGMLHLLGHDHLDDASAEAMEALEEDILAGMPTDGTVDRVVLTRHREEDDA
ncbi:rRNA maturation RNase YbeY [Olsenella uli]|uniref:rRNA maturation RNase YbeY n=1 Tax=Olsenella uli TaxID=133926 RepID=UPI0019588BAE|nr:rRNA maturation RNase YbeY [Olsenella uli]MBM6817656.1 rRNA maturation RNase YbeY [Olsenella uli]